MYGDGIEKSVVEKIDYTLSLGTALGKTFT